MTVLESSIHREPTHEERYGTGDTIILDRIYDLLKSEGYVLQYSDEGETTYLVHGEEYMSAYPSEQGLELCLFDDFSNPFDLEDFHGSEHAYVQAIIKRFAALWQEYQEWC